MAERYSGESESDSEFYPDDSDDEDLGNREDQPLSRKKWDAAQVRHRVLWFGGNENVSK